MLGVARRREDPLETLCIAIVLNWLDVAELTNPSLGSQLKEKRPPAHIAPDEL